MDPYTPQPDSLARINTDIMLIGYVVFTGPEPNVYMTFKGVIIPTTIVNKVSVRNCCYKLFTLFNSICSTTVQHLFNMLYY